MHYGRTTRIFRIQAVVTLQNNKLRFTPFVVVIEHDSLVYYVINSNITIRASGCSRYARAQGEAAGSRKPPVLVSNDQ